MGDSTDVVDITGDGESNSPCSDVLEIVTALSSFSGLGDNQLQFDEGDELHVLKKSTEDWWWAELDGSVGYIPVNHVVSHSDRQAEKLRWQDDEYFGNYGSLKLHLEMLGDRARTQAYQAAVEQNMDFMKGKVVMDVGCGTGILSMFCARCGKAAKVFALEASQIATHARSLVAHNNLSDVIQVIEGQVETVDIPEKVDIIISEWMGTLLLFELMIEAVMVARDRWLKPGGVMWPSHSRLYLVPCSAHSLYKNRVEFWGSQYGFDFSCLREVAIEEFFHKPVFNHELKSKDCLAKPTEILAFDMKSVQVSELEEIQNGFEFDVVKSGTFHGLCSWFSVDFAGVPGAKDPVVLSTGPNDELTHWKQDLFVMDHPVEVEQGDRITGNVHITRNPQWRRHLRVLFTYQIVSVDGQIQSFEKRFLLWR